MSSRNRASVPEARTALDAFKYEVASEIGVLLSNGYNGDLTFLQNGSVGGHIVKKMCHGRTVKKAKRRVMGEWVNFTYSAGIRV